MKNSLTVLALMLFAATATAKPWWMRGVESNEADFLPPDVAFRVAAVEDSGRFQVRWVIADGYYLYRTKIAIKAESPDLIVGALSLPAGQTKVDPYFGNQEIYRQQVQVSAGFSRFDGGAHPLQIKVTYQGCADAGLCYPPITKVIFPHSAPTAAAAAAAASHPWEVGAILAGVFAFFLAGAMLRKGRKLDLPPA